MEPLMKIIPAIDIQDGKCVRLTKGDLNSTIKYFDDPVQAAEHWYSYGIDRIHIVDLDGAKKGQSLILNIIDSIKKKLPKVSLQVGGGFRNKETIERALNSGIDQIILGSLAVKDSILFHDIASSYPDKIIFGLDTKNDHVKSEAWTEDSGVYWIDLVKKFNDLPLNSIIFTDIDRDGMLNGPNLEKINELTSNTSLPVIASGGVSSLEDLIQLKKIKGVSGVISGKALYENTFSLDEALNLIS